jgi:phenylacetate-coenzyme A ligase PaaK-like adenylate-forming protein
VIPAPDLFTARCAETLDHALAHVPAYRSWRAFDPGGGATVDARYRALPALTKQLMNLHTPAGFVADGRSLERGLRDGEVEIVTTSGTTEDKVQNLWYQPWWNASERASWALNAHARRACSGDHREAILVSPLNVGVRSEHPLPMEQRRLDRFLYLNELVDPLAWPESHYRRMLHELELFRPAVLEGNPSLLARLCRHAARLGARPFQPALVTMTYEYPSLVHRRHIRAVFDAPLVSSYGSTEAAYVFMECEHGLMHQNTASCRVDFLPFAADRGSPSVGKLLLTTFDNPWRALVRFDAGDLGRLADGPCPCGRTDGLTLAGIEGRAINLTLTPEGKLVTQADVDRRLAAIEALDEYQLLQLDGRSYALRVVSDTADPAVVPRAEQALRALYGPAARIAVSRAAALAPEASGKYRLVKASFPIDSTSFVEQSFRPPLPPEAQPGG